MSKLLIGILPMKEVLYLLDVTCNKMHGLKSKIRILIFLLQVGAALAAFLFQLAVFLDHVGVAHNCQNGQNKVESESW